MYLGIGFGIHWPSYFGILFVYFGGIMGSLERYFEERDKDKPKAKWVYGDRVSGKVLKDTPVMGMVIREDYNDPKQVLVHLDLPVKVGDSLRHVVYVNSKTMKRLVEIV